MNCPNCNNPIPANANNCPGCGAPIAQQQPQQQTAQPKSRTVYGLLAFFLGGTGIHNFYAKRYVSGVIQLLLSLCYVCTGSRIEDMFILVIIMVFWVLIEMLVVRKDGNGVPFAK